MANEFFVNWVDEDGVETRSLMHVTASNPSQQSIQNLIAALGSVSAAGIAKYGIILDSTPDPAVLADNGPYDVADKLVLEASTSLGGVANITVPAPAEVFMPDSDVVASSELNGLALSGLFTAIQAAYEYDGATLTGTSWTRGYRIRTARRVVA